MNSVRSTFWALALGIIAAYAFFLALGAFSPGEVVAASAVVGVLLVLWIVHGLALRRQTRRGQAPRDAMLTRSRERRGF